MHTSWRKIVKIVFGTLLGLALLFLVAFTGIYIFLGTSNGKIWLTGKLSKTLSKEMGVEVKIGSAELDLPGILHLHDVFIKDHHQNPMLQIADADAQLAYYNFASRKVTFGNVYLNHVHFYLTKYKGEEKTNVGFIIKKLTKSDTASSGKTNVLLKYIQISDGNFVYNRQEKPVDPQGIDWNHLEIKELNGRFSYLVLYGADIAVNVQSLSLEEKSGFVLNDLRTRMKYTRKEMEFNSLRLLTPNSEITDYLKFTYANPLAFNHFIDSVYMDAHFINSKLSLEDLAYFTPKLQNKSDVVDIYEATAAGTVTKLRTTGLDLAFGKYSFLKGRATLRGLPVVNETFIDAKIADSRTSFTELSTLFPELPIPAKTEKLGKVALKGNFTGFLNDFVTYGSAKTDIGEVETDLNLKLNKNPALSKYNGKVKTNNFNIGYFLDEPMLGLVSVEGKVSGSGLTKESVNANISSIFQRIDIWNYSYNNITANGDVKNQFFQGKLAARDSNLNLDFSGTIDFNKAKPEYNFVADIREANLFALGFTEDTLAFSTLADINLRGNDLDDMEGLAKTYRTRLYSRHKTYNFDTLTLHSQIAPGYRNITVSSDLLNAYMRGDFKLSELPDLLKTTANRYLDSSFLQLEGKEITAQNVDFQMQFKDLDVLFRMFRSDIILQDSGYINGTIQSGNGAVSLEGYLPQLTYKNLIFKDIQLDGNGSGKNLDLSLSTAAFGTLDSIYIRNFKLKATANNDKLSFTTYAADRYIKKQAELHGDLDIIGTTAYLQLDSSQLLIGDTLWQISAKPITIYSDTLVDFPLFTLANGNQKLKIVGKYSGKTSYPARIILEEFGIPTIASFVPEIKGLSGNLNGQILVNNLNTKKPIAEAALFASPVSYKGDTLGTFTTTTSYNEEQKLLTVEASIQNKSQEKTLLTTGTIAFANKQALDFDARLNRTNLRIFESFLSAVFSDLSGTATADMKITGTLSQPVFKGSIDLQDGALTVSYLNTRYHFDHKESFNGTSITLHKLALFDERNNKAELDGTIDFTHINDIKLALKINAENFQVLNTTQNENNLYYGEAYGTGYVSIDGPLNNLRMYIKMRTDKGTRFYLPISESGSFTGFSYIKFIDKTKFLKEKRNVKLNGLRLAMDMEITPDAVAQIIFDPRVGDLIEGRGEGNLRMDINTEGDFSMYGLYTITEGNYLFTAYDVINKAFDIKPGGTISWHGSPYDATLNMQAAYKLRTTLGPLISQTASVTDNTAITNRTYPVEAQLNLTGALFSPDIKMDFEIQELTGSGATSVESAISAVRSNEQELSKQVVSLLVLNQFAPVQQSFLNAESNLASSAYNSSVGDLVSSQVNYYLSQIVQDVQVGIDYKPVSQQRDELTLRVSTDLFDDRANVDVGYDVTNYNHNAQVSYKLKADGNTRAKIFSRSNNNPLYRQSSNTIGIGIFFRKEFDKLSELFKKK